ncbi:MAG TPA: ABC transporter ATP-binding protein, partial [Gemmata sp.]|nr:ABC transporter ATP-binding protein [Gemmata sp.]
VIIINKGRIKFDDTMKSINNREPTLVIEVRGPAESVTAFLRDQRELASVTAKPMEADLAIFEIRTRDRRDQREELAKRIAAKGWGIRRLELRRESLEDLFTAVVLRESTLATPTTASPPEPTASPVA